MTATARKVCMLGEFGVGKSSLVARFLRNTFDEKYLTTVGVKVDSREVALDDGRSLKLVLWDIAGKNALDALNQNYLRGAPSDRSTVREYVHLLLYALNKPDEARPWVDRLLKDDPEDEAARMDLAATLWRSSHFDEALQAYVDVLTRRPDNARAVLNIAYMHYDALAYSDDDKRAHWPKARQAFRLFLQLVRPEDGYDYFEKVLAVPYRLKEIEAFLGPAPEGTPTIESIR